MDGFKSQLLDLSIQNFKLKPCNQLVESISVQIIGRDYEQSSIKTEITDQNLSK